MPKLDHIKVGDPPKYEIKGCTSCVDYRDWCDDLRVAYDIVNTMLTYIGIKAVSLWEWGECKEIFFPRKEKK